MPTPLMDPASTSVSPVAPLRVLLYYPDFGQQGGIERYIETCANSFNQHPHVTLAVACTANGPLAQHLQSQGVTVYPIQTWSGFMRPVLRVLDWASIGQLKQAIQNFKPDVVHVHIGTGENLWIRALGVPVLYTFHGYGPLYHLQATQNPLKRFFKSMLRVGFRAMARGIERLQFVSQAEQQRMVAEGFVPPSAQGEVLHNAVDIAAWQALVEKADIAQFKAQAQLPEHAQVISMISRLDANKNPMAFVTLAQRLIAANPDKALHFVLAGSGPLQGAIQAHVTKAGLSERIHVLGHVQDIPALLKASSLVVHLPSQEGFGMGVLEAMAAGVPCLAYQTGGIPEILGDSAQFNLCRVTPHDENTLFSNAQALLMLSPEEQHTLQDALKQRAQAFDLAPWCQSLETSWHEVASIPAGKTHLALGHMPLVSVIMPVYNGEAFITAAVASVLTQTYANLELLVIDDGSTDQTQALLAQIKDPRLKVLTQQNQGVSEARNHGVREAQGDYLSFLDADDLWFPDKLSGDMSRLLSAPNPVGVVYSSYYAVDLADRLVNLPPISTQSGSIFDTVLASEGMLLPSLVTMHKSVVHQVGGFTADSYHEDRVFFLRVAKQFPIYATGKRMVAYRQSLSGRCRRILNDYDLALSAENSIMAAVQGQLSQAELQTLTQIQIRSLFFRFFVYGFMANAKRLQPQVPARLLTQSIKGKLARLSLTSGVNVMNLARLGIQTFTRFVIHPWWCIKRAPLYDCVVEFQRRYVHH